MARAIPKSGQKRHNRPVENANADRLRVFVCRLLQQDIARLHITMHDAAWA